jgi:hypothetical protein
MALATVFCRMVAAASFKTASSSLCSITIISCMHWFLPATAMACAFGRQGSEKVCLPVRWTKQHTCGVFPSDYRSVPAWILPAGRQVCCRRYFSSSFTFSHYCLLFAC